VTARSKAWTVYVRSNAGIVGSNPTQGMNVFVRLFCVCVVLCVGSGLATGWSPVQGVLPTMYRIKKLKKAAKAQYKDCRTIDTCFVGWKGSVHRTYTYTLAYTKQNVENLNHIKYILFTQEVGHLQQQPRHLFWIYWLQYGFNPSWSLFNTTVCNIIKEMHTNGYGSGYFLDPTHSRTFLIKLKLGALVLR
jgi:hypothetical protein